MSDDTSARLKAVQSKMARVTAQRVIIENREALARVTSALAADNINLALDGIDLVIESLTTVRKDLK